MNPGIVAAKNINSAGLSEQNETLNSMIAELKFLVSGSGHLHNTKGF